VNEIASGSVPLEDSALHNAPHTADDVVSDEWGHGYGREMAAFPVAALRHDKYWPPVSRIDGAYGDRHVMCACPPIEVYEQGIAD
jgi:glycine dehydrogenase